MPGESLDDGEELVRALIPPRWDRENQRVSASAFVDFECSVSRTAILTYEEIKAIYIADLHNPPDHPLSATISVSAGAVREACVSDKAFTTLVRVDSDEVANDPAGYSDNPAHALIKGFDASGAKRKLSRGMSSAIIRRCAAPVLVALEPEAGSGSDSVLPELPDETAS